MTRNRRTGLWITATIILALLLVAAGYLLGQERKSDGGTAAAEPATAEPETKKP